MQESTRLDTKLSHVKKDIKFLATWLGRSERSITDLHDFVRELALRTKALEGHVNDEEGWVSTQAALEALEGEMGELCKMLEYLYAAQEESGDEEEEDEEDEEESVQGEEFHRAWLQQPGGVEEVRERDDVTSWPFWNGVYSPSGECDVPGEEDGEIFGSGDIEGGEIIEENEGLGEQVACPLYYHGWGHTRFGLSGGAGD
jgi:hypothetical protein